MSVYTMDKLSLAKYLSDTKIYITPRVTGSTLGERVLTKYSRYDITVDELKDITFCPSIDVFVDEDGLMVSASVGSRVFTAMTHEYSKAYDGRKAPGRNYERLPFDFVFPYFTATKRFSNEEIDGFDRFMEIVDEVVFWLENEIGIRLDFDELEPSGRYGDGKWYFKDIMLCLDWDIRLKHC